MGVSLEVFCLVSDDQVDTQEMGIPVNLEDCVVREYCFFSFDFVAPTQGNPNHCILSSGGSDFLINKPYAVVKQIIQDSLVFKFN